MGKWVVTVAGIAILSVLILAVAFMFCIQVLIAITCGNVVI